MAPGMVGKRSRRNYDEPDTADEAEAPPPVPCWLCPRPLGKTPEWHHPVPKSRGGKAVVAMHPICHQTLHANFSNSQLARIGDNVAALLAEPEMAKFLDWIADKDPEFYVRTAKRK
jgi:hypothetical protein